MVRGRGTQIGEKKKKTDKRKTLKNEVKEEVYKGHSQKSETKYPFSRIPINLTERVNFLHTNQILFILYVFFVIRVFFDVFMFQYQNILCSTKNAIKESGSGL